MAAVGQAVGAAAAGSDVTCGAGPAALPPPAPAATAELHATGYARQARLPQNAGLLNMEAAKWSIYV